MKIRIPEIILGALVTVGMFAVGVLLAPLAPIAIRVLQETPDDRLALWTSVLATSTIVLAVSTIFLWRTTARSVDLARDEFVATHRPRVIVRTINGPFVDDDGRTFVNVVLVNIGDTPATIDSHTAELALWRNDSWVPPGGGTTVTLDLRTPIGSGGRSTFRITALTNVNEISYVFPSGPELRAEGTVQYRDVKGTVRETGFARIYDVNTSRFIRSDNPDWEYSD